MKRFDVIKSWFCSLDNTYLFNDILLVYIDIDNPQKGRSLKIQLEYEDFQCIIKKFSTFKNSDIDTAIKYDKKLILYFHKPISLISLNILKDGKYKYLYYDLRYNNNHLPFILKTTNPIYIVEKDILYIKNFITIFLTHSQNQKPIFIPSQINIFLFRSKRNITLETIHNDILFLEHYNKLTSRLAIFIYKICTFEFHAGEKEIGLYFNRYFGKSKPLNKKKYGIQNVKGYDIKGYTDNPILNTKIQIARNLSIMINKPINQNTILQATNIDINKLQGY